MDQLALPNHDSLATDKAIREISGRGHLMGLSTPFTHSALVLYAAGGRIQGKSEEYLLKLDFLKSVDGAKPVLSETGQHLLDLHTRRGDRPAIWAEEMSAAARKQPHLVAA
jgi:hypothetical protein